MLNARLNYTETLAMPARFTSIFTLVGCLLVTSSVLGCGDPPPTPKQEAPKPTAPKPDAPKPEAPNPEAPKPEPPKPDAPKPEAPKPEAPKPEAPKPEAPKPDAPKPDASKDDVKIMKDYWGKTNQIKYRYEMRKGPDGKYARNGAAQAYYEHGVLEREGNYKNGKRVGIWKYYDDKGNFLRTEDRGDGGAPDPKPIG